MANDVARFEIKLPLQRRLELDRLAHEAGISSADLARLAINQLLVHRQLTLGAAAPEEARP